MHDNQTTQKPATVGSPPKYQLALMIWLAVFPTLVVLQLLLHRVLAGAPMILRTLVLASIAIPIVVYGLMPPLQRLRAYLITHRNRPCGRARVGRTKVLPPA